VFGQDELNSLLAIYERLWMGFLDDIWMFMRGLPEIYAWLWM
jgi:hypothetical protein